MRSLRIVHVKADSVLSKIQVVGYCNLHEAFTYVAYDCLTPIQVAGECDLAITRVTDDCDLTHHTCNTDVPMHGNC